MCKEVRGILVQAWPKGVPISDNFGGIGGGGNIPACVSVSCSRATFHPIDHCITADDGNVTYRFPLKRFSFIGIYDAHYRRLLGSWREGCGYICYDNPTYTEMLNNASQKLHTS